MSVAYADVEQDNLPEVPEVVVELRDAVYFNVDITKLTALDVLKIDWYLGKYLTNSCEADVGKLFFSQTLRGFAVSKDDFAINSKQVNTKLATNMIKGSSCLIMQANSLTSDLCYRGWVKTVVDGKIQSFEVSSLVEIKC